MKHNYLLILFQFLVLAVSAQEVGKPIRLKTGTLPRTKNIQNERNIAGVLQQVRYKNRYYTLIQFSKLPSQQERQELAHSGIVLYNYIPQNTFLAEVSESFAPGTLKKHAISGVFTLEPPSKIAA